MKNAGELRAGSTFKQGNNLYIILKAEKFKSTAGRRASAVEMKFKLKDLITGNISMMDIEATEKLDDIRLDRNKMQFLYESDGEYFFMDQSSFEQISLTKDDLEDSVYFLEEEMVIDVLSYDGRPVGVELPNSVDREVTYTEPGLRGDTTGRATKSATISSGYELQVPLFIEMGEKIKIDTRTGEYLERSK